MFPETSIWVSPFSLLFALKTILTAVQDFWSVLLLSYMRFSLDVITGSRRRPPEDRLDWQLVLALSIYERTNRVDPHPVTN